MKRSVRLYWTIIYHMAFSKWWSRAFNQSNIQPSVCHQTKGKLLQLNQTFKSVPGHKRQKMIHRYYKLGTNIPYACFWLTRLLELKSDLETIFIFKVDSFPGRGFGEGRGGGGGLKYSSPGKDQFRYIKIHLRLRGLGLNEAKEIISRLILLFPRASEPSMNFNVSC